MDVVTLGVMKDSVAERDVVNVSLEAVNDEVANVSVEEIEVINDAVNDSVEEIGVPNDSTEENKLENTGNTRRLRNELRGTFNFVGRVSVGQLFLVLSTFVVELADLTKQKGDGRIEGALLFHVMVECVGVGFYEIIRLILPFILSKLVSLSRIFAYDYLLKIFWVFALEKLIHVENHVDFCIYSCIIVSIICLVSISCTKDLTTFVEGVSVAFAKLCLELYENRGTKMSDNDRWERFAISVIVLLLAFFSKMSEYKDEGHQV